MQHVLSGNNISNEAIWSISQRGFQNNIWLQNLYFNFPTLNPFDILVFEDRRNREQIHKLHDNRQVIKGFTTNKQLIVGLKEKKKVTSNSSAENRTGICMSMEHDTVEAVSLWRRGLKATMESFQQTWHRGKEQQNWKQMRGKRWYFLNQFCLLFPTYISKD